MSTSIMGRTARHRRPSPSTTEESIVYNNESDEDKEQETFPLDHYFGDKPAGLKFAKSKTSVTTITICHYQNKPEPLIEVCHGRDGPSLRHWTVEGFSEVDGVRPSAAMRCVVISCSDSFNITRDDIDFVVGTFEIPQSHSQLLFCDHSCYATTRQRPCWHYGQQGLRASASTNPTTGFTSGIIVINASAGFTYGIHVGNQDIVKHIEKALCRDTILSTHPFMLGFVVRVNCLSIAERSLAATVATIRQVEEMIGFNSHTVAPKRVLYDGSLEDNSRRVNECAGDMGRLKVILPGLGSVEEVLYSSDQPRWIDFLDQSLQDEYKQQTQEMVEADVLAELTRQSLVRKINEYHDRAKNAQSLIFNLIAQNDVKASIHLADETRKDGISMKTIAIMTMIFLPATFYAALFAVPSLQWGESPVIQANFWVYWAFTIPTTLLVLVGWYILVDRQTAGKLQENWFVLKMRWHIFQESVSRYRKKFSRRRWSIQSNGDIVLRDSSGKTFTVQGRVRSQSGSLSEGRRSSYPQQRRPDASSPDEVD